MMTTLNDTAAETVTGFRNSTKFRRSCDKCQNSKVRCNRDKPICKRCAQRRVKCIYSPLRRIGRPKKATEANEEVAAHFNGMDVDDGEGSLRSGTIGTALLSPDTSANCDHSTIATSPHESNADHPNSRISNISQMRYSGHLSINDSETAQQVSPPSDNNDVVFRSVVDTWISDHQFSIITPHEHDTPTNEHPRVHGGILPAAVISTRTSSSDVSDCYAAVLERTSRLEQALTRTTSPPTIDLVLEAERNFSSLQQRLFACTGHQVPCPPENASPLTWAAPETVSSSRPCLATSRPVLLGLALLAERVIGILEDMFRLAAKSAQSMDQASDFVWSGTQGTSAPSARRLQRSLRNVMSKPCVSLEMDSYRALRLDDFLVQGQAKVDAMGRILKLRVKRMLGTLEALDSAKRTKQGEDQNTKEQFLGSPLDWGGSTTVLDAIAGTLLDDLIRRAEALQGAMILL